jgi:hypothetical protein
MRLEWSRWYVVCFNFLLAKYRSSFCSTAEEARKHIREDYTEFTKGSHASFAGKRIGVPRDLFFDPQYWE